ncbi:MAG: GAF domain-containing protein [Armatimonadetes bacterium]|nr:GAF domain-containing protein [Armatimonadota bacterium]
MNESHLTSEEKIKQLEKSLSQLSVLYSIASSITVTTNAEKTLELVLEKALDILKAEIGAVFLKEKQKLTLKVERGGKGVFPLSINLNNIEDKTTMPLIYKGEAFCAGQTNSNCAPFDKVIKKYPVKSIICSPIKTQNKILGTICIGRFFPDEFTEQEKWLLKILSNRASVAIESSRLYKKLKKTNQKLSGNIKLANKELIRRISELKGLYEIAQSMTASMDIDKILKIIINKANQLAGTNISTLRLLDKNTGELLIKASTGVRPEILPLIPLKVGEGIVGEVAQTGILQIINDLEEDNRFDYFPRELQKVKSKIVVPLKINTNIIGILVCASAERMDFTQREVDLLTSLANLAAIAIENAKLYQSATQEREEIKNYLNILEKREIELKEANQIKSQFLSTVSHELRTPLTTIIGYLNLFMNKRFGTINEKQENIFSTMEKQANNLKNIIDEILDISARESGKGIKLNFKNTNITEIIKDIIFLYQPIAEKKVIKIKNKIPKIFPEINCDPTKITQVFSNLLDNALKFTDKGEIIIEAINKKNEIEFIISDTGIGIAPEYAEKIFERFFQIDSSDTRFYDGTGIGLAIAREIIHAHNGIIKVKSQIQQGSKFIIRLPKLIEESLNEIPLKQEDPVFINENTNNKTILIIDDDKDLLQLVEIILKGEGFNILTAGEGLEGLKKLYENKIDLIFLDIRMPKIDGFDICKIIKKYEITKNIPVVILSAAGRTQDIEKGMLAGADEYIVKPFQPETIIKKIKNILAGISIT